MFSVFSPKDLMWPWFLYLEFVTAWSNQRIALERQVRHNTLLFQDARRRHLPT